MQLVAFLRSSLGDIGVYPFNMISLSTFNSLKLISLSILLLLSCLIKSIHLLLSARVIFDKFKLFSMAHKTSMIWLVYHSHLSLCPFFKFHNPITKEWCKSSKKDLFHTSRLLFKLVLCLKPTSPSICEYFSRQPLSYVLCHHPT